jgi:hypothetical protein
VPPAIEFLDPHAVPAAAARAYAVGLGARLDAGATIGLLANGFADSDTFLDAVEGALRERLPNCAFVRARKPSPTVVMSDEVYDDLAGRCDAVVSAYGH